jgi:prepilin-type N-terminal cleavage/methylation domain-containing protein
MNDKRNLSSLGFSLAEILVTVAILGILSTIAVNISASEADRAKVNTAQIALAGWLQLVQRSALLQKSLQTNQGGCTVNFASALSNQGNGTQIASVSPAACAPNPSILLDIPNLGSSSLSASFTAQSIIFTPRGTISSDAESPVTEIRFLISRSSLLRCVRISGLVGVIEIGSRGSGSTLSNQCSDYARI